MANGSNTTTISLEVGDSVVWEENEEFRFGEICRIDYFESSKTFFIGAESKDSKPQIRLQTTNSDLFYKTTALAFHEIEYMNCG